MSLGKVVNSWQSFRKQNDSKALNVVALIGYHNSGKSTFAELNKAFIGGERNPQLKFDDGKVKSYVLPSIISANSLKVATVSPQFYTILEKESMYFLDVPAFCTVPFQETTKKYWSTLDAKITFNYLTKLVKKCSFVLVLDEKFTRQTMDGLKNMITTFIQMFDEHSNDLFASTAIMLSKCPPNSKKETYLTRLDTCVKKLNQHPKAKAIDEWIKSIRERNALLLFSKFASEDSVKEEITNLYKDISGLKRYENKMDKLQKISNYPREVLEDLKKYLEGLPALLEKLISLVLNIADGHYSAFDQLIEDKNKIVQDFVPSEQKNEEPKQNLNQSLPSLFAILSLCRQVQSLLEQGFDVKQKKVEFVYSFIISLKKMQILNENDLLIEFIEERCKFYLVFTQQLSWDIEGSLHMIEGLNRIKDSETLLEDLPRIYQKNKDIQYYKNVKEAIDYMVEKESITQYIQLQKIWIESTIHIAKGEKNSIALQNYLQLEDTLKKSHNHPLMGELLDSIAEILVNQKHFSLAVNLFGLSGNPYRAIKIFQPILQKCLNKKIDDYLDYAEFLRKAGLHDTCLMTIYKIGSHFQQESDRKRLGEFLTKVQKTDKKIDPLILNAFIKQEVKGLEKLDREKIKKIIEEIKSKEKEEN